MGVRERNVEVELTPEDVARVSGVEWVRKGQATVFCGVFTDTRFPIEGGLFFGLKGERFDGSDFAGEAVRAGGKGVVVRRGTLVPEDDVHVFESGDTLFVLGELARAHRRRSAAAVVAITGSVGKTTTKEMTARIFMKALGPEKVLASEGNLNNLIGAPLNLFRLKDHEVAVIELGTNRFGELARLAEIAEPDTAVITAIAPAHLEFFGDVYGVLSAKWELIDRAAGADAVLNRDDELLVERAKDLDRRIVWFGAHPESDVRLVDVQLEGFDGLSMTVEAGGERARCRLRAAGSHQARNALCAMAIAYSRGIGLGVAAEALEDFEPLALRGRVIRAGDWLIIDDSYNASPQAVRCALELLGMAEGERIAVLGDMLELGDASRRCHFEIGEVAAKACDLLIAVGEFADDIKRGAVSAGMDSSRVMVAADWQEALEILKLMVVGEATVLVKASRLVGLDKLVKALEES